MNTSSSSHIFALRQQFHRDGYIITKSDLNSELLQRIIKQVDQWAEQSRTEQENYGKTLDGKARFDLQPGHNETKPMLRRVSNPVDISADFRDVVFRGPIVDKVASLIGPDVKFHHCKLNNKLPHSQTRVDYHQDHPFDPHTNDDIVVALLLLDDMDEENGCLHVVPGSHKTHYSHYEGDTFTGRLPTSIYKSVVRDAVPVIGKRGDLILQHTWMVHGGEPNRSSRLRRMLITDYTAADANPLTQIQMPSEYTGRIVAGTATRHARATQFNVELPPKYEADSFFGVQEAAAIDIAAPTVTENSG